MLQTIGRQIGFAIENARLFEETSKFKLGIERSGDAIFMTDTTGKILYANRHLQIFMAFPSLKHWGKRLGS
jgi:PAS domain-containing protein